MRTLFLFFRGRLVFYRIHHRFIEFTIVRFSVRKSTLNAAPPILLLPRLTLFTHPSLSCTLMHIYLRNNEMPVQKKLSPELQSHCLCISQKTRCSSRYDDSVVCGHALTMSKACFVSTLVYFERVCRQFCRTSRTDKQQRNSPQTLPEYCRLCDVLAVRHLETLKTLFLMHV